MSLEVLKRMAGGKGHSGNINGKSYTAFGLKWQSLWPRSVSSVSSRKAAKASATRGSKRLAAANVQLGLYLKRIPVLAARIPTKRFVHTAGYS